MDIKNAFGCIPHQAIVDSLRAAGAGDIFCALVADIYSNTKTCLLSAEGLSEAIDLLCGVKSRGARLAPPSFPLAIDPVIRAVQRGRVGVFSLNYADDEAVIEDSPEDLQNTINILVETAFKVGLSINPKSASPSTFAAIIKPVALPPFMPITSLFLSSLTTTLLNISASLLASLSFPTMPHSKILSILA